MSLEPKTGSERESRSVSETSGSSNPVAPASQATAVAASSSAASPDTSIRRKRGLWVTAVLLLGVGLGLTQGGCYYVHLAGGQWRLWNQRQPLERALASEAIAADDRKILALVPALRSFALGIGLDADKQYRAFVAGNGDRVLTNVVATPTGQLDAHLFRFPLVGRFPYKGFFDPALADAEAERLRGRGFDVCVSAVPAYSTLGWLADPVTAPMLRYGEGVFAEMALHEWVHATVFARGESDFNEGIATFIGQEGAQRFFEARSGAERGAAERARVEDERDIARVLADTRAQVKALYAAPRAPGDERIRISVRSQIEAEARGRLAALPLRTREPQRVAQRARLGDACLALAATYEADLDRYRVRLDALDGDLARFVAEVRDAAKRSDPRATLLGAPTEQLD